MKNRSGTNTWSWVLYLGFWAIAGCADKDPLVGLCEKNNPDTMTWEKCNIAAQYMSDQHIPAEAKNYLLESFAIAEKTNSADQLDHMQKSLNDLKRVPGLEGNIVETTTLLKRYMAVIEKVKGAGSPEFAENLNNLAGLYMTQGKPDEAEPLLQRALGITEKIHGDESLESAEVLNNLAGVYQTQNKLVEAEKLFSRALSIRKSKLAQTDFKAIVSQNNLALIYLIQKRFPEAEKIFKDSIAIIRTRNDTKPQLILLLESYIYLLQTSNRNDEALAMIDEVRKLKGWPPLS